MEIDTLIYHLNKYAIEYSIPYFFTDNVLEQKPLKFNLIEQENDVLTISMYNNETINDELNNKTFKYGNNVITILETLQDPLRVRIDNTITLPKRTYELKELTPILVKYSYVWNNSNNGSNYITYRRIDFNVRIDTDPFGKIYSYILDFVSKVLFKNGNSLQLYDKENNKLIKNKYMFIDTNVTTSEFINNRDNVSRVFYIVIKTYNNI